MKKSMLTSLVMAIMFVLQSCNADAQKTGSKTTSQQTAKSEIQLIQFHSEHRCKTCKMIEANAIETAKKFDDVTFVLYNVNDSKNEKLAEKFEAAGTALFLYNPKTGKKEELTDFAFMNASNKEKFIKELSQKINSFK